MHTCKLIPLQKTFKQAENAIFCAFYRKFCLKTALFLCAHTLSKLVKTHIYKLKRANTAHFQFSFKIHLKTEVLLS